MQKKRNMLGAIIDVRAIMDILIIVAALGYVWFSEQRIYDEVANEYILASARQDESHQKQLRTQEGESNDRQLLIQKRNSQLSTQNRKLSKDLLNKPKVIERYLAADCGLESVDFNVLLRNIKTRNRNIKKSAMPVDSEIILEETAPISNLAAEQPIGVQRLH